MEQNKAQYDLDTQIARILAWSSGNLEKFRKFKKNSVQNKRWI